MPPRGSAPLQHRDLNLGAHLEAQGFVQRDGGDVGRPGVQEGLLAALAGRYPLRFVDGDACAKPTTVEDVLERQRVTTLYLSRVEPA